MPLNSGELATRYEVSEQTIRNWSNRFARFLSPGANPTGDNAPRSYNNADEVVIATIAALRQEKQRYEEIQYRLAEGFRVHPILPEEAPTPEDTIRGPGGLTINEMEHELARRGNLITGLETERNMLEQERDEWRRRYDGEHDARIEAEKRAARAEGKLEAWEARSEGGEAPQAASHSPGAPARWWEFWKR